MKKIQLIFISLVVVFFSACGGGGGDSSTFDTGLQKIDVEACPTYLEIQDNDLLVKDSGGTIVEFQYDSNGTRSVCLVSGSAHIIREN